MADAIVSIALQRLAALIEKQIGDEINLVRGVKKELVYLSSEFTAISNVLEDAEKRRYRDKGIQQWLKKLESISYDVDDVLDEWNYEVLKLQIAGSEDFVAPRRMKVCSFVPFSCFSVKKVVTRRDMAVNMKGLRERLDMIVEEKDRYGLVIGRHVEPQESERVRSTSLLDVSEIHGRRDEKEDLVRKLVLVGQEDDFCFDVISIVGVGGIGKTALAQVAFNDPRVREFFDLKIWICVSDVFDEIRIAKGIVEIVKQSSPDVSELEALLKCVTNCISGKRFILVWDDVWTEDYDKWEPFKNTLRKCGRAGSKILVTTRSERVARMMGTSEIHSLGILSDSDCWLLMRRIAFLGRSNNNCGDLEEIGKNIAKKCKGLPLAAKVLGSLLHFKETVEEWANILASEIWQLEEAEVMLFPHLFLSYKELSPPMKHCFSYCAVFPKDFKMNVQKLIRMWMAQGYLGSSGTVGELEVRGKEYVDKLRMRSLLQDFLGFGGDASCKMHDIVHDFAQHLRKTAIHDSDAARLVEARKRGSCDPSVVSQIKVYRSLFDGKEFLSHPLDTITCLRSLSLCGCSLKEIPMYVEKLIHLRYFDLSDNKEMEQVPQAVCRLYNLQSLYLSNCGLKEIAREIGNLINLRHLDLKSNYKITELPESICSLHDLRTLNIDGCSSLARLPDQIHRLINLRHLPNHNAGYVCRFPEGFKELTRLQTLNVFRAGEGWSKSRYLKKLDQLSGSLELLIHVDNLGDALETNKAELRNKKHIHSLKIWFFNGWSAAKLAKNKAMDGLQPPPNLQKLTILDFQGTKFPNWFSTTSVLYNLKDLEIQECNYCSTLPPLGELPCLEVVSIWRMNKLKSISSEFLGIPTGFPKLKRLRFRDCCSWEEWEDITDEEAADDKLSIMPCLTDLEIERCKLKTLPHRLLRKASELAKVVVEDSVHLCERYRDKDGSGRRSLSHIPKVAVSYIEERAAFLSYEGPLPVFYG